MQDAPELTLLVINYSNRVIFSDCHDLPKRNRQIVGRNLPREKPQEHLSHEQEDVVLGDDHHISVTAFGEEPDSELVAVPVEAFSHVGNDVVPNPSGLYHFEDLDVMIIVSEVNDHKSFKYVLAVLFFVV